MSTPISGNEPAYPSIFKAQTPQGVIEFYGNEGMTIRQKFAAMAMEGLCANPEYASNDQGYAKDAVARADALIAELNKPITTNAH